METASTNKNNTRRGYSSVVCRNCGEEIYFDDNHLSKNGRKVPLSKKDGKPHQCPNRHFNGSGPLNTSSFERATGPIQINTIEPILAEILRTVKKVEKYVTKSSPNSDSVDDPKGGGRQ
jgi:hypothetical protein